MSAMKSPRAKLDALLALLNSAAQEAIAEYEKTGDVPSTESPHPLDFEPPSMTLRKALRILEGACEQLCTTLSPPGHTMLNRLLTIYDPTFMNFAVQAKVADVLVSHPEGLPVADIANKTETERGKLARILRCLATKNCFREVRHDVFANNRLSLQLVSSAPLPNMILLSPDITYRLLNKIHPCLTDPEYGPSLAPDKSVFMYKFKGEGATSFFDYLKHNPRLEQLFTSGMVALSQITGTGLSIFNDFPWRDMAPGSTVCDIGSGVGDVCLQLVKDYSGLKVTLQDQPQVLEKARALWAEEYPNALEEKRVDFVSLDFLKEGPVKNQDIYYMRQILHDWPDAAAAVILKNVKSSMGSKSRLLIHEKVLCGVHRYETPDSSDSIIAPEPLLVNFGAGNIRPYYNDMSMMIMFNGRERSLDDFKALGVEAGLEFVKIWDTAESAILEFKIAT